jgi:hypothetical protein
MQFGLLEVSVRSFFGRWETHVPSDRRVAELGSKRMMPTRSPSQGHGTTGRDHDLQATELWISGGWETHHVLMLFARVGSCVYVTLCGFNIIFAHYDVERVQKTRSSDNGLAPCIRYLHSYRQQTPKASKNDRIPQSLVRPMTNTDMAP